MFPSFCLTEGADRQVVDKISRRYRGNNPDALIAHAAAEVEGTYYGKLTRVEEIIAFANRIGAKRIGIATCIGLIRETRVFVKVLKAHGLEPYTVCCKVGSVDKTEIGIPDELKVKKGSYEAICNPILQAHLLNEQKTDLNVIVGLCVGHDSLFIKHSRAYAPLFQGLRTTFSCVFEGFSGELSSHYIINTNCNALYSPIHYRKVANM